MHLNVERAIINKPLKRNYNTFHHLETKKTAIQLFF